MFTYKTIHKKYHTVHNACPEIIDILAFIEMLSKFRLFKFRSKVKFRLVWNLIKFSFVKLYTLFSF